MGNVHYWHNEDFPFKALVFQVTIGEVQDLFSLVQRFMLVYCLQEVVWSLVKSDRMNQESEQNHGKQSETPAFILDYGIARFQQYHRNKYNILTMNI